MLQILKKKEGILRMKMLGKSVYTIISPDPLINTREIFLYIIHQKIFFPEKVIEYNLDYMKKIIKNSPFKSPGIN